MKKQEEEELCSIVYANKVVQKIKINEIKTLCVLKTLPK